MQVRRGHRGRSGCAHYLLWRRDREKREAQTQTGGSEAVAKDMTGWRWGQKGPGSQEKVQQRRGRTGRDQRADPGAHSRRSLRALCSFLEQDPENPARETEARGDDVGG